MEGFLSETEESRLMNEGIGFSVIYVGCIEVYASMKVLDFETRSKVAKECIRRVCDTVSKKTPQKRVVDKVVQKCISNQICKEHSGTKISMNISSRNLELKNNANADIIARHDMPRISFASGGDEETLDYIAYVAKDITLWRACYVINCGFANAQSIISVLGRAFDLRFKEYKEYRGNELERQKSLNESFQLKESNVFKCDQDYKIPHKGGFEEYYNDMPGKIPPDVLPTSSKAKQSPKTEKRRERASSNLIDLDTAIDKCHDYVNEPTAKDDTFEDFSANSPEKLLQSESWFHGKISRAVAESLLSKNGDFLVRESLKTSGQYILTGKKSANAKHLLLIDPDGCVRTKDRKFDSIPHLINYHWNNQLPIISAESSLLLQNPIFRKVDLLK